MCAALTEAAASSVVSVPVAGFSELQVFVTFLAAAIINKFHVKVFSSSHSGHAVIS